MFGIQIRFVRCSYLMSKLDSSFLKRFHHVHKLHVADLDIRALYEI